MVDVNCLFLKHYLVNFVIRKHLKNISITSKKVSLIWINKPNGVQLQSANTLAIILLRNRLILFVHVATIFVLNVWKVLIGQFIAIFYRHGMIGSKEQKTILRYGSNWTLSLVQNARHKFRRIKVVCIWLALNADTSSVGYVLGTISFITLRQVELFAVHSMML